MLVSRSGLLRNICAALLLGITCTSAPALAADITITHARGETVLHDTPRRVAVFDLATLDNINALGVDAVAGVPKGADGKGNFPPYLSKYADARYQNIGTLFEPDKAALAALKPDLIVIAGRSSRNYDALAGIAPTIDGLSAGKDVAAAAIEATRKLGQIFDVADRAEARIDKFEALLAQLHTQAEKAGTGLLLFTAGQNISVHAPGDRFGHVYDFVGIRPAVAAVTPAPSGPRPAAGSPEAEAARQKQQEALAAAMATNPDWIFVIDRTAATSATPGTIAEKLAADDHITATSAWKSGRMIYLDPKVWYLVGAGIDGLSASATATLAALRTQQ